MALSYKKIILYASQIWYRLLFWTGHALEEVYYSRLGKIYFDLGDFDHAAKMFRRSEKSHSGRDYEFVRYNQFYLGYCYLNLGDFKNASESFSKYTKFDANNYEVNAHLATCYSLVAEPENALKMLMQISEIYPDAPSPYIETAKILSSLGRKDEAIHYLERAASKYHDPNTQAIISAMSLEIRGDLTGAIAKLKDICSAPDIEGPDKQYKSYYDKLFRRVDLLIMLAQWQRESGDKNGARITIEAAFESNKNDKWILNDLATEWADQNIKLGEALNLIDRALNDQPANSLFLDTKAWILYKLGDNKLAKTFAEKSLNLNPNHEEIRKHYREINST